MLEEVDGLFDACMTGDASIWFTNEIKGRNYQLDNILDNTGVATATAFRALNNGGLTGINANQFRGQALVLRNAAGGDNTITGANIIPAGVWDEDWSIAGGHPAPAGTAVVAPNANGGGNVVLPGMKIGQKLYELEYNYTTTNALKQSAAFGTIVQGTRSVQQFASDLRRIGRLAKMTPEQIREQWLRGLSPMNQNNIRQGGMFFQSMDEQLKNLSELEAYTFSQSNISHQIIQQPVQQNSTYDQFKSELEKERSILKSELLKQDAKHKADIENLESKLQ
jgi:hypothetical protein